MKIFIVLCLASCALARPEAPLSSSYFPSPQNSIGGSYPSSSYGVPQQQPIVHKHVYVHVPPPEAPEYKAPRYIAPAAPPQKHYKIVFIKAPTPPTPTAPVINLPQPDEEKTLIYVLVKKPEEQPELVIPTVAPTQPSKPEVYFIRYKTQKDQSSAYGVPNVQPGPPIDSYGPPDSNGPY